MRRSAITTVFLLFSTTANADDILTTLHRESGKAALSFYNGDCSEDNLPECAIAQLGCTNEYPFVVRWDGFSEGDLATWLSKSKGAAAIVTERGAFMLRIDKIEYSGMNANWDVSLTSDAAQEIWRALPSSKRVSLANVDKTLHLAVNKHMSEVSNACAIVAQPALPYASAPRASVLEVDAIAFATQHAAAESSPASLAISVVSPHYADVVSYYGKQISRAQLLRDYRAFVARWPERTYQIQPGSIEAQCIPASGTCNINAMLDWVAVSKYRGKKSVGQSTWFLSLRRHGMSFAITAVNGEVVARTISDLSAEMQSEARVP